MHRAFLSLYLLIVASVVLVGLGLDALLGFYAPDDALSESDKTALSVVRSHIHNSPDASLHMPEGQKLQLFSITDFANTQLAEQLLSGDAVVVHSQGQRQLYQWLDDEHQQVVVVTQKEPRQPGSMMYNALIIVFYLAIAIVVFLWIWPLSRDLRSLEAQTRLLGQDHLSEPLNIGHASPVYDLSSSFNRMSERVKALLASHKEMTYAVSHELRTPLARMKFALEMAKSHSEPQKLKQQLLSVKEDVTEMDALVNQLLAYAGFEHSTQALEQQDGDMGYLIERIIERVKLDGGFCEVEFQFNNEWVGQSVTCEWHLLERVVQNLIQNAARFAQKRVMVTLKGHQQTFEIWVEDDGPGVAVADRERVFESFVRLSNHVNAKSRGFGLGLAIVRRVALWHGGSATVEASNMGGACFKFVWPATV